MLDILGPDSKYATVQEFRHRLYNLTKTLYQNTMDADGVIAMLGLLKTHDPSLPMWHHISEKCAAEIKSMRSILVEKLFSFAAQAAPRIGPGRHHQPAACKSPHG